MDSHTKQLLDECDIIFKYAKTQKLLVFVIGWFAVDFAYGKITRNHHDIDIMVEESDLFLWEQWFVLRGFTRKNFLRKSQKYCFILEKDGISVDIGGVYYEQEKVLDHCDFSESPFLWPMIKDKLFWTRNFEWIQVNFALPETIFVFKTSNPKGMLRENDIHDLQILREIIHIS